MSDKKPYVSGSRPGEKMTSHEKLTSMSDSEISRVWDSLVVIDWQESGPCVDTPTMLEWTEDVYSEMSKRGIS